MRADCADLCPETSSRRRRSRLGRPRAQRPVSPHSGAMSPKIGPQTRSRRNSVHVAQGCAPPTFPPVKSMPGMSMDARRPRARPALRLLPSLYHYLANLAGIFHPIYRNLSRVQGGFRLPCAALMRARVAQREQASCGLCRGGRDFFLRALVVENDDNENEFYRDDLIFMIFHQNLASF